MASAKTVPGWTRGKQNLWKRLEIPKGYLTKNPGEQASSLKQAAWESPRGCFDVRRGKPQNWQRPSGAQWRFRDSETISQQQIRPQIEQPKKNKAVSPKSTQTRIEITFRLPFPLCCGFRLFDIQTGLFPPSRLNCPDFDQSVSLQIVPVEKILSSHSNRMHYICNVSFFFQSFHDVFGARDSAPVLEAIKTPVPNPAAPINNANPDNHPNSGRSFDPRLS